MKFKNWYWDDRGCQVLAECEIGRTANAAKQSFSLTGKQKLALSRRIREGAAQSVAFDGYDYRSYRGLYGYPKRECVAARFLIDGKLVAIHKDGAENVQA